MAESDIARVFWNGRSQAVRLPRAFRVEGGRVRVRRVGRSVVLEPLEEDWGAVFADIDRLIEPDFMAADRDQPPPQDRGDPFGGDLFGGDLFE